jgi:hypothetical protein
MKEIHIVIFKAFRHDWGWKLIKLQLQLRNRDSLNSRLTGYRLND